MFFDKMSIEKGDLYKEFESNTGYYYIKYINGEKTKINYIEGYYTMCLNPKYIIGYAACYESYHIENIINNLKPTKILKKVIRQVIYISNIL